MEKSTIKNRKEQNIVVVVDQTPDQKGLVFLMHGLGGFKEQPHIEIFAQAFKDAGYTVIRFDTTNTLGESDGDYYDATTTNYYEDLEDVIKWAESKEWYSEPFCLVGHSLGGISITLFAEKYPDKVKALAPISSVISGKLREEIKGDIYKEWKEKGYIEKPSVSKPGVMKRLAWGFVEDLDRYDVLPEAGKLIMPVLLIVGGEDEGTPVKHQKMLFNVLPGKKEMHIIEGAGHTFRTQVHLDKIKKIFDDWIKTKIK